VVVCDDAPALRELTRYGLEGDSRLQVIAEAADAEGAVRHIAALRPDCLVLDLSMPGTDGLETIPLIREASPETAIVVFSNFSSERLGPAALEQGADRYVRKGRDFGELRQVVIDVCQSRDAPR
jgi:DNA-binding NarL/FixJ family response regulator